ncbi:MAG TPA: NO-inducible flavohemoprotein [Polyangiaceae bacterium]|nr:NO-inducible flavohemoprotein [Polyangiaceae bacterium]
MLSDQTKSLVRATVPALQQHGEAIARRFYDQMLREHPALRAFFNQAHQASGAQARALARAVVAYAQHLDRLEELAPLVTQVVQKHVSLGVLPEHYPVVGRCLLGAVADVLGEAATPDVLRAWGEAYGALADLLTRAEEAAYRARAEAPGGWRGARAFRVARVVPESATITSFYLEPADGGALLRFEPGQYITLLLQIEGALLRRNYSLSGPPGEPFYRISVKREPGGLVSNWLHDRAPVGTELRLLPPAGAFVLEPGARRPLVLLTAGVGVTPAMSMLESVAPSGRPVRFVHATQCRAVHAFRDRVDALAARHANVTATYYYDEPGPGDGPHQAGRLDAARLAEHLPADRDADVYLVGPKPFMQAAFRDALASGVPRARIHYEFFGPDEPLASDSCSAQARPHGAERQLRIGAPNESIM